MDRRAKLLFDHWQATRRGRHAPFRHDINPGQFREILDSVFVLDWNSTSDVRYRLAGSRLCESFGMELRGMNMLALWQGEARARLGQLLHRIVTEPCVGHAVGIQENDAGFTSDFEILLLPLKREDGALKRIIGCNVLTSGNYLEAQSSPIISHWIDSVTVFDVALDFEIENTANAAPALQMIYQANGSNATLASAVAEPALQDIQVHRGFRVIEGGLALKQR